MSDGNEPALPADNQQAPNASEAAVAAAAGKGDDSADQGGAANGERLTFTHPQPDDVDDAELLAAKAAAEAEKTADEGDGQDSATTGKQDAAKGPETEASGQKAQGQQSPVEPPMIPKARFDEVNNARSQAEREAAYWRGVAEARAQMTASDKSGAAAPAQPTPEQRLQELYAQQDALAAQFDSGEITMAEFKQKERELDQQIDQIREAQLAAKLRSTTPTPTAGSDALYLETLTAQLEDQHQWVRPFNAVATDSEWDFVAQRARENLAARGVELKGPIGTYELRKEIAAVIDRLGPALIADRAERAKELGFAFPATPVSGKPASPQQPSSSAQARLEALKKANNAPPDLSSIRGTAADSSGVPSEDRLEQMSDEEIAALPRSVQNRLLGIIT